MTSIVWWEIETPEPDAFRGFHSALWGWAFESAFADTQLGADYWVIHAAGESIGGVQRAATKTPPHPGTRLYLEVSDLERTLVQVTGFGGQVDRGRTALGGDDRWFATITDPSGVTFGLWTAHPPMR